jgi:hypothetical protein
MPEACRWQPKVGQSFHALPCQPADLAPPPERAAPVPAAVTRGKRLVVIVGQKKAMAIAVKGKQTGPRWSKLREWLCESRR